MLFYISFYFPDRQFNQGLLIKIWNRHRARATNTTVWFDNETQFNSTWRIINKDKNFKTDEPSDSKSIEDQRLILEANLAALLEWSWRLSNTTLAATVFLQAEPENKLNT